MTTLFMATVGTASAQTPGAPLIGPAFAGNAQVFVSFTAPASAGVGTITAYTATCTPNVGQGAVSGSGITAPINVSGLVNNTAYNCAVTATNAAGVSAASATVSVTPLLTAPLTLIGVKSRKTHGAAGIFDVPIDSATLIGGSVNVEPRVIGAGHSIVFQFNATVTSIGPVTAIDESAVAVAALASQSGNEVVVALTGIADNKRVNVALPTVNGTTVNSSASVGFLVGDVNDTRAVNSSDISSVKARSGQTTTVANFRADVNATGAINASDISATKSRSGTSLRSAIAPSGGIVARVAIDQTGLLLTQVGDFRQLSAKAFDAQGNVLVAPVTWTSGKPAAIVVDAGGKATATGNGTSQIVAAVGGIQSAPLLALVTQTAPGAILISDAQIIGEPFETTPNAPPSFTNTYQVRLSGVSPPAIGSIIMNTESKAVAGRVVAVDSTGNPIIVTLALLTAREMFPTLDFNETIDMSNAAVNIPADIAAAYNITRVGNTFSFAPKAAPGKSSPLESTALKANANATIGAPQAGATGTSALPPFTSCEVSITGVGGQGAPLPIALSAPPLFTVTASPVLDVSFNLLSALLVKRFVITAEPVIKFEGGVSISAAFEGKIECKAELFAYVVPAGGPLALILGGVVPFGVGFEAGGKITVATMGIGTKVEVKGKIKAGVVCPGGNPPCTFERAMDDFTAKVTPTLDAPSLGDLRIEPSLSAFGYMEASIGNVFLKSLRFDFVKAKAAATLAGSFALKESQILDPLYASDYKLSLDVGAGAGGKLGDVLTLLGLPAVSALELKASTDIAKSPAGIAAGAVTADKASFVSGETVNFTIKLDPATVDFFPIIGPYNVKKIQLVRKVSGVVTVVASVNATPAQTTFNLAYTAPDSGSVVQFSAFVVTTLLPLDLLSLELGQATGGTDSLSGLNNEVQVAMDAQGNTIVMASNLGASQGMPSKIVAHRFVAGTGWVAPQFFESIRGQKTPKIAMDAGGNAIAIWQEYSTGSLNIWMSRFVPATGWAPALLLSDPPEGSSHHAIVMNTQGDALVSWIDSATSINPVRSWARAYRAGSGWEPAVQLGMSIPLSGGGGDAETINAARVSVDLGGLARATWIRSINVPVARAIGETRQFTAAGWGATTQIPNINFEGVSIAVEPRAWDINGNAVGVWEWSNRTLYASRYDAISGWGLPLLLTSAYVGQSNMQFASEPNGTITATWSAGLTLANPGMSIQYSRFIPGGGWSGPLAFGTGAPFEYGNSQFLTGPKIAVLAACTLIATWEEYSPMSSFGKLWTSSFTLAQGWSPPTSISEQGPNLNLAQDSYHLAASGNGHAVATWGGSLGTIQAYVFPHHAPDANACSVTSNVVVSAPAAAIAGETFPLTVEVQNTSNQRDTNFVGTVRFASTDPAAVLPANYTFTLADAGSHTFNVTLGKAGAHTVSAAVGGFSGSRTITVSPGAPTQLAFIQPPGSPEVSKLFTPPVRVGVSDAFDNVVTNAAGSVTLTLGNNSNSASLLGITQSALVNGVATFGGLSINKAGTFSLIATYPGGLTRTSGLFTVTNAPIGD